MNGIPDVGGRPLVLVVDDDPDILDAVCDILEGEHYRVARARHGGRRWTAWRRSGPPSSCSTS